MAVNPNWPFLSTHVAWNVAGNDTTVTPTWTDISTRVREMSTSAGRQYEIDQNQAGEADYVISDKDEAFNPANASSPYAGGILPYRPILEQATWPPAAVGAAVNMMNAVSGYDPSLESTAVGSTPPNMITFATTPTVTTTKPFFGANCLQWNVTASGGPQYIGFTVPCVPGQQYQISCYYWQTAGNQVKSLINGGTGGSFITTAGAWVRYFLNFTATQPTHQWFLGTPAPTLSGTMYADGFQMELGNPALPATFALTGPVLYGVFRGFIEQYPKTWNHKGLYGMAELNCVDQMGVLANSKLHTEVTNAIFRCKPTYYWRLNEDQAATSWADISGNNGPPLTQLDSVYGPATTFVPATATNIPGDPGGVGVAISTPVVAPQNMSVLQTGSIFTPRSTPAISIGGSPPFGYTACVIAAHSPGTDVQNRFMTLAQSNFNQRLVELVTGSSPSSYVGALAGPTSGFSLGAQTAFDLWADGLPHVFIMTAAVDATNFVINLYVDGTLQATQTLATSAFTYPLIGTQIQVGGLVADVSAGTWAGTIDHGMPGGVYSHAALWNRVLSTYEIGTIRDGKKGFPGENTGARIIRYLSYVAPGAPLQFDTGMSYLDVSSLAEGTAALDASQAVTASENGNLTANASGVMIFQSRRSRYLSITADWVLGEQESPYEDGVTFNLDPTRVANTVKITRTGGIVATAQDLTSQKTYFEREFDREINVATDGEAVDASNALLAAFKDAHMRVSTVTLKPSANPALWPVALGIAIGDRTTVMRRAISGGVTMAGDYFVEKVSRSRKAGEFTVSLELSPATGKTPWILGDAVYGVLDSTTILGY